MICSMLGELDWRRIMKSEMNVSRAAISRNRDDELPAAKTPSQSTLDGAEEGSVYITSKTPL